jgi:hypothetical protein
MALADSNEKALGNFAILTQHLPPSRHTYASRTWRAGFLLTGRPMDYFIIAITTVAGVAFHAWLIVRFRRWADRDLALSMAGSDPAKRSWMLQRLAEAKTQKIKRRDLQSWLEQQAQRYPAT